ncbi:MAG: type II secretion system protein, partial [Lachnospiraceae bacterium]|nr:type II secretion system protein [Lachnospiraceae bacterium]
MKKNNGFALIELVVSLAIMGIVGLVLFEFIAISSKTFRSVNTEVNLQYESQLTINQLKDLIVDSNRGVVYGLQTVAGGFTEVDLTLPNAETIQIQNLETAEAANVGT